MGKLGFCCIIPLSLSHRRVGTLHEHCTSYCTYVLFLSALPVSLPWFSLPAAVFCFQSHISVVSFVSVLCVCRVCVCVCVCVFGAEILLSISVLAIATDQIRTAVSLSPSLYLSLSPSLPSLYLPPSFTRQYSLLFSFLLFLHIYCYRRECRYFLTNALFAFRHIQKI